MGLISKIEDKLSSDKGSSESSKLQKSSYEDSSSGSHLRHPVSSGTTGSQGYGSSTTGTSATQGYGSSTGGTTGSSGLGSSTTGTGGHSSVERDGYGKADSRDTSSAYGSSTRTDPRESSSTGDYGSGPREPYDPYSSKGQQTAANAATGYPSSTSREDYGSSGYSNDPNVPRTREGGVMNAPTTGGSSAKQDPYSSTSRQDPYSSTSRQDPYATSTQTSSSHPIRDAAMAGGAGTAAGGAAGYGASKYGDDRSAQDPNVAYGQHASSTKPQDVSYMNQSSGSSETAGGSSGMSSNDPKKMGGAYEAGYRDAMEHAKAEMGMK